MASNEIEQQITSDEVYYSEEEEINDEGEQLADVKKMVKDNRMILNENQKATTSQVCSRKQTIAKNWNEENHPKIKKTKSTC